MHARCQPGKTLQQSLDIGIWTDVASVSVERQPPGYFWKFTGKLTRHLAQMPEFLVVVIEKTVIHRGCLPWCRVPSRYRCSFSGTTAPGSGWPKVRRGSRCRSHCVPSKRGSRGFEKSLVARIVAAPRQAAVPVRACSERTDR